MTLPPLPPQPHEDETGELPTYRDVLAAQLAADSTDRSTPVPVLLSHAAAYVVALVLGATGTAVTAAAPTSVSVPVDVVVVLVLTVAQAAAAWLAHSRVTPVPVETGAHAVRD